MLREEVQCLVDGHVQHVIDVLPFIAHVQDVVLEAVAVTGLALQYQVGHELHLDGNGAGSLTLVAATAIGVEREILGREAHLLRQRLLGKEFAYRIVGLHIRCRIGTC